MITFVGLSGIISSLLFLIYGIPQIVKLYKVKDAKQFSVLAWLLLSVAMFLVWINMLFTKANLGVILPYTVNAIEVFWITILVIKFR